MSTRRGQKRLRQSLPKSCKVWRTRGKRKRPSGRRATRNFWNASLHKTHSLQNPYGGNEEAADADDRAVFRTMPTLSPAVSDVFLTEHLWTPTRTTTILFAPLGAPFPPSRGSILPLAAKRRQNAGWSVACFTRR